MFLQYQHIMPQKFWIQYDQILSIRWILDKVSDSDVDSESVTSLDIDGVPFHRPPSL